jgi:hypothetical protein
MDLLAYKIAQANRIIFQLLVFNIAYQSNRVAVIENGNLKFIIKTLIADCM